MIQTYAQPSYQGRGVLERAIERRDPDLATVLIAAALHEEDFDFIEPTFVRLGGHEDEVIRGNAVLALGHVARRFGRLGADALAMIRAALTDPSPYVCGQAHAAAGDAAHFLGVELRAKAGTLSK